MRHHTAQTIHHTAQIKLQEQHWGVYRQTRREDTTTMPAEVRAKLQQHFVNEWFWGVYRQARKEDTITISAEVRDHPPHCPDLEKFKTNN